MSYRVKSARRKGKERSSTMVKIRRNRQPRKFNLDLSLEDEKRAREIVRGIRKVKPLAQANLPHERSYSALLSGKRKFSLGFSQEEIKSREESLIRHIKKHRRILKRLKERPFDPDNMARIDKSQSFINNDIVKLQMLNAERQKTAQTMEEKRIRKQAIEDGLIIRIGKDDQKLVPTKKTFRNQEEIDKVFKNFK